MPMPACIWTISFEIRCQVSLARDLASEHSAETSHRIAIDRIQRRVHARTRQLQPGVHFRGAMLQRLKRPDELPELRAGFEVLQRGLETLRGCAQHLGGKACARPVQYAIKRHEALGTHTEHGGSRHLRIDKGEVGVAAAIDGVQTMRARRRSNSLSTRKSETPFLSPGAPVVRAATTTRSATATLRHKPLRAGEGESTSGFCRGERNLFRPMMGAFIHRQRSNHRAVGEFGQPVPLLLNSAAEQQRRDGICAR